MAPARLSGLPAAPGVAVGPAWRFRAESVARAPAEAGLGASGPAVAPGEAIRAAAGATAGQLEELAERLRGLDRAEEAAIFEAQAMMAQDPSLVDEAVRAAEAGQEPGAAVEAAAGAAAAILAALEDEVLSARAADVRDVGARIARTLRGETLLLPSAPSIAVADDLPPSVTAEIPAGFLLGVVLAGGSRTAHAVILARSLGIPAVVGATGILERLDEALARDGAVELAEDGESGEVVLEPGAEERARFEARGADLAARRAAGAALRDRPAATADGERVLLLANIGTPDDAPRALAAGAEGVGLFRTEFLFMSRPTPPSEAEQAEAYRKVLTAFGPQRPVVIRLADIGGDKAMPYLGLPAEANPFLGVRAIRLAYASHELLHQQLRAVWRAGAATGVVPHVMAPMVATLADVELLLQLRDEARASLVAEGQACAERIVTGIMVEIPSAALMAAELAQRVDFFSIGTNDLTQYLLAADRGNAALASLQDALHPAVLRAVAATVRGADASGIPVAVCGELAGDPAGALVLVALGVDELSADAGSLDEVRRVLSRVTRPRLEALAVAALAAADAESVRQLVDQLLAEEP